MTRREHEQFMVAKRAIEGVFRRLGVEYRYLARDWARDQKLMHDSAHRKQVLRQREAELVAVFEGWRHGQPIVGSPAVVALEQPEAEEQERAS